MRVLNLGVIIAFLIASTHMVVDHGGAPRDFALIPHVGTLLFYADDHDHEPSSSPTPCHHDADTHTHVKWYTTTTGSVIPYQPISSAIVASYVWLTEEISVAPPRFRVKASTHPPPRAPLYLRCCSCLY